MPLFTADDMNALPNVDGVTEAEAAMVERIVWGWLSPVLELTERPDPVGDTLFAWALELAVIYRANPEGLSSYSLEAESSSYDGKRRDAILREAASGGQAPAGTALAPQGCFPAARTYPDPAEPCW